MEHYLHALCRFLLLIRRRRLFLGVGLIGLWAPAWAALIPKAPADLIVTVSSATVCAGTSTSLTASGCPVGGTVRWSTAQTGNVIVVAPKQTTSYTAICEVTSTSATSSTVTSATTTATGIVRVYSPIGLDIAVKEPLCHGLSTAILTITSSGGVGQLQYQLNDQPFQLDNTFSRLKAGTYSLAAKDTIGCTLKTTVQINDPPALSALFTVYNTKCVGGGDGALIVAASGGVGGYRYSIQGRSPQTSNTFLDLRADTTYTIIIADKNDCVLYQPVYVGQAVPFTIKLTPALTRCVGSSDGSISVAVTGGILPYQYQLGTGAFQTGAQFTGLAAASYTVTIKDGNGCLGTQSVTIGQPAPLTLTAVSKPAVCSGPNTGAIIVTPTGGTGALTYQVTTSSAPQSGSILGGVAAGNYTVVGTDANGCTSLVSVTVGKVDPLKAQASSIPATCCNCPTGAVKLTSTGGTGTGLQYQIIGQALQSSSQISKLPPNNYRMRVVDDGGCADTVSVVVTDAGALTLSTGNIKNVSCSGGHDGEATVLVAGGRKPFTYYWLTERLDTLKPFTATQTNLPEATYTVSVRDSSRCTTNTLFVSIKAQNPTPIQPTISQVANSTLVANQTTGVQWYVRTATTPDAPVSNATSATLVPYASGQYYAVVTVNGCPSPPSDVINFVLTALTEPTDNLSVRIIPNPISDRLRLEVEQPERSAVQVYLVDASGRVVRAYQVPAFIGKKQVEWALDGVSTGNYLLKVAAESRQSILRVAIE